jgi:hypothetical protein
MIFLKTRIEFPWAEIATFTFSFLISFFNFLMNLFTLFSTSAKDSPFGGLTLYPRWTSSYSFLPRNFSILFLSFGSMSSKASPSIISLISFFPTLFMKDSWDVPESAP